MDRDRNQRGRADVEATLYAMPGTPSRQYPVPGRDDRLECALRLVIELVQRALAEDGPGPHGDRRRDPEHGAGQPPAAWPALARLTQRVRHRPGKVTVSWHSWTDRGRVDPQFIELLQESMSSGGQLKIVADKESADEYAGHLRSLANSGARVRVHNSALPDLLVLDREAAVLRGATGGFGPAEQHLVTAAGLVASLTRLLTAMWVNAADLKVHQRLRVDHDSLPGSVLTLLSEGCTDETAARKLDISVRTYRRHVADIMQRLNAGSRFQAGFEAARLTRNEYDDAS